MKATHLFGSGSLRQTFRGEARLLVFIGGILTIVGLSTELRSAENSKNQTSREGTRHWAFAPLRAVEPEGGGLHGSSNPIDRFVLKKLRAEKLEPVKLAEKPTLARRLYFDLIGLPPAPEALNGFLDDA